MSLDKPNEYERAVEIYATMVRQAQHCERMKERSDAALAEARARRQAAWRVIQTYLANGQIKPGVYRLNGNVHSEALVIEDTKVVPDLLPMFR